MSSALLPAVALLIALAVAGAAPAWGGTACAKSDESQLNVLDNGVKGDGVTDDAPAIRALFASGRTICFPPNRTYYLNSASSSGYPAMDDAAVIISRLNDFHVLAYGATFRVGPRIALSEAIFFDRDTRFTWDGGEFIGNRVGLGPAQENVGMGLFNNKEFRINDVAFTGYGGLGAAFAMDWNVSGLLSNLKLDGVGICFDSAFSKSLTIANVVAQGADANGRTGVGHVGEKCFSNIFDRPNAAQNKTGIEYGDTDGVTVRNLQAYNFHVGVALASGAHYRFSNNYLHDNPGQGSAAGIGYYIYYINGGVASSIGAPVADVVIRGDRIGGNGAAVAGAGVIVDASTIKNGDRIGTIKIDHTAFEDNNDTAIAVRGANISGVVVGENKYEGKRQKARVSGGGGIVRRESM